MMTGHDCNEYCRGEEHCHLSALRKDISPDVIQGQMEEALGIDIVFMVPTEEMSVQELFKGYNGLVVQSYHPCVGLVDVDKRLAQANIVMKDYQVWRIHYKESGNE